jgi:hypothetical protein
MTRVGLRLPESLSFGEWEKAGSQIARVADSTAWCLGDWLAYGQARYVDRYQQAIVAVGLDYQTLRNYTWVAKRFDLSRRRAKLSFQHHAEVASLTTAEQDMWLDRAEEFGWSRNQLRINLQQSRAVATAGRAESAEPAEPTVGLPRLSVEQERIQMWRRAAEQANAKFENWIISALDQAAAQLVPSMRDGR